MLPKVSKTKKKLILASGSRIRRQLLEGAGLEFQVINSNVDEDLLKKELYGRSFREQVSRLASEKARTVSMDNLEAFVIGSDNMCTIDDEILAANPNLKVVANFAVGFNNIDVDAATRRQIPVTNTPGVLTDTTADMAFALLMDAARRVAEGDRFVRTKAWQGWGPLQFLGADVTGATLGLIGLGRIGRAMIPRARGFQMRVLYWNRTRLSAEEEERLGIHYGYFPCFRDFKSFVV